jgi:lysophospholipase L1-like esterase
MINAEGGGNELKGSSRFIWRIVGVTATLSTIIFLVGFILATKQILYPKPSDNTRSQLTGIKQQTELESKEQLNIVALGDSLTTGLGDHTGKGYVGRVRDKLEKLHVKPVYVRNNLAIPGYSTRQLVEDLASPTTQEILAQADIILLTIGGNDLFAGGQGLFTVGDELDFNPEAVIERIALALEGVEQVLSAINSANSHAIVLYIGLYHPFLDFDRNREGALIIQQWNNDVFAMMNTYANMVVVPTYDLFELKGERYLASDHFHPNDIGYEAIAERISQILQ